MTTTITITMPLPPKELSPNARSGRRKKKGQMRTHWASRAKLTHQYRRSAAVRALAELGCGFMVFKRAIGKLTFYWPDKRRRDIRNAEAAMKPAYDGLVDAGIIVDDDHKHLIHDTTEFKIDKENPRVEITVSEVK